MRRNLVSVQVAIKRGLGKGNDLLHGIARHAEAVRQIGCQLAEYGHLQLDRAQCRGECLPQLTLFQRQIGQARVIESQHVARARAVGPLVLVIRKGRVQRRVGHAFEDASVNVRRKDILEIDVRERLLMSGRAIDRSQKVVLDDRTQIRLHDAGHNRSPSPDSFRYPLQ